MLSAISAVRYAHADYAGPVPRPADSYGQPGPFTVETRTFASPGYAGQVVTVFVPKGAPGPRPTWFFAHGFGGINVEYYGELLRHWASHGWTTVFSPYPTSGNMEALYDIIDEGFIAAAGNYPDAIDTRKVGFAGHSYGGGATPALALRAVRDRGWGEDGLCLCLLAPWYSGEVTTTDLQSFPSGTQAVIEVYEDDVINDHRMAIDVFRNLGIPAADKDYLYLRSDWIDGYGYAADHTTPVTGDLNNGEARSFDALDTWGVLRIGEALAESCFNSDTSAHAVALGGGSSGQTMMGATSTGHSLRHALESDDPLPLFPESRYDWKFSGLLNPRRNEPPPETPAGGTRLVNLSARARSGAGEDVLIVGATVEGPRPKSLLIRGVGPSLAGLGVSDALSDPRLATFVGDQPDLANEDWWSAYDFEVVQITSNDVGAFPLPVPSDDAAVLGSFAAGGVTAQAQIESGPGGVALIELYDSDLEPASHLSNLSARARVGTGDDVLVAGFVVGGNELLRVLVRGIGPSLAALGVDGALPDPKLTVLQDSQILAENDAWSDQPDAASIASVSAQVGAFELPTNSADACLLLYLPPGAYTAQVSGVAGSTGVALAEIYAVP